MKKNDQLYTAYCNAARQAESLAFDIDALLGNNITPGIRNMDSINWGDVGTLCHLIEKLTELRSEIKQYTDNI